MFGTAIQQLFIVPLILFFGICLPVVSVQNAGSKQPIVIAEQGSFFVGGRKVKGDGVFDPTKSLRKSKSMLTRSISMNNEGQTFWIDQMYVQYQIPVNARMYPLVLVHGGGGTGRVWESTPDGREGYQTLFLRRGYAVYIVDIPRRGRSGQPTFSGPFGNLDGEQVVPNLTLKPGVEVGWTRWRIGPTYPEIFKVQQFPTDPASIDQFFQSIVPYVSDDADIIADTLAMLLDKIGPSILVTHSQSGLFGWLTANRRPAHVKAIISYEPGYVFPEGNIPPPVPLFKGAMPVGTPVSKADFDKLARVPLQIVHGDNIPASPVPDLLADGRRAQVIASRLFQKAINDRGGDAEILYLPDIGLYGNTHFMFSDLNNVAVADQLALYLRNKGLDRRKSKAENSE